MRIVSAAARALVRLGFVIVAVGLVLVVVGLYAGTWPLRRAAGRSPAAAKLGAAQTLLEALAGAAAVFRS